MFNKKVIIRYSEGDSTGRLSMEGLLRLFQDIGYQHAVERGFGDGHTQRTGRTWYLLSWRIEVVNMPCIEEEVEISTWFYEMKGATARKNLLMKNAKGEVLAYADTVWVYVDVQTQSAAPTDSNMWPESDYGEAFPMEPVSRRLPVVTEQNGEALLIQKARPYLIDTNNHANNVKLTLFAMELCGADFGCEKLRVEFKNQVPPGALIYPYIIREGNEIFLSLKDEAGKDYTTFWFYGNFCS